MANRKVIFDIEANDKTDKGIGDTTKDLDKLKSQTENVGNAARSSGLKFTELNQALEIGRKVFQAANDVYQATVTKLVQYADTVRTLKDITGETSEEMSRVVQLTDDYKISAENLTMVQKTLAQQGKSLSIETLAKMSDEYLKLNTGTERQLYLTKNLGREGDEYAGILSQGGEAIRDQSSAISEHLILSEDQLKKARELEIAQDNLNDSWDAATIAIGTKLIPEFVELVNWITDTTVVIDTLFNKEQMLLDANGKWTQQLGEQGATYEEYARKILENARATGDLHYSVESYLKMIDSGKEVPAKLAERIGLLSQAEYDLKYNTDDATESLVRMRNEAPKTEQAIDEVGVKTRVASDYFKQLTTELIYNHLAASMDKDAQLELARQMGLVNEETYFTINSLDDLTKKYDINRDGVIDLSEKTGQYDQQLAAIIDKQNQLKDKTVTYTIYTNQISGGGPVTGGGQSTLPKPGAVQMAQAAGGSGIVPPGYNHDNFLVGLSSGERYDVKPSSRVGASDKGGGGSGGNVYNFNVSGATSPEEFLRKCATLVKQQGGLPQ